jgi:hypothetical protein
LAFQASPRDANPILIGSPGVENAGLFSGAPLAVSPRKTPGILAEYQVEHFWLLDFVHATG